MFFQSKKSNILDQRYNIAFFSAIFAFLSAIIYSTELYSIFIYYIVFGLVFDQFVRFIKPAPLTEDILNHHKMTTKQIETYVKSKKTYRLIAASISILIGLIAKVYGAGVGLYFIISYAGVWSMYPLLRILFFKVPAPKLVRTLTDQEWQTQNKLFQDNINNRHYDPLTPGTLGWQSNRIKEFNALNSHSTRL